MDQATTDSEPGMPRNSKLSKVAKLVIGCCLAAILLASWNAIVTLPVHSALAGEDSHRTIAYRRWLVAPNEIVLDIWGASAEARMVDLDRQFFKAARALKERTYSSVILAYRGKEKFAMEGSYFKTVGEEYGAQNPIYVMRTMQEHVANLDGSPAFGQWTGGWIAVMGKQLEDHNAFHARWWLRDAAGLDDGKPVKFK